MSLSIGLISSGNWQKHYQFDYIHGIETGAIAIAIQQIRWVNFYKLSRKYRGVFK